MNFLPYARQSILPQDIEEVIQALQEPIVTRGPKVEAFEQAIADYCGAKFAVAFNSGTSALHAAYYAAETSSHDRLLTTPNTFVGSVSGGILYGANPIFIDIDRDTGNIDLEQLDANLNQPMSRGREIIMVVHFGGTPIDMQQVDQMIKNPHTITIEDAAHALGSSYSTGEKVGCCLWSQMTAFSFHPSKTITTLEGGMVTTNHEEFYERLRLFRDNGIQRDPSQIELAPWYYEVQDISGNHHFTDIQAALGLSQLKHLRSFINQRKQLVKEYRKCLQNESNIRLFSSNALDRTAFHIFVVQIDFTTMGTSRKDVMDKLSAEGIGSQVHYIPLYQHPFFKNRCGNLAEYFPNMEAYYAQALTLPLHCEMDEQDVQRVVQTLIKSLG